MEKEKDFIPGEETEKEEMSFEEESSENENVQVKPMWQLAKEQQYAKLNVTEKQLNIVIALAGAALAVVFVMIGLDALGIF